MDGVKNLFYLSNMRLSRKFILEQMHLEILLVSNNLLDSYQEKLSEAQQRLETVYEQLANAKEEVGKPFPKEEELNQKLERLSELNALLNMDEREDTEVEQSESKEKEERPARGSIHEKLQIYKEKKPAGKREMAGKTEIGTSVWNKKSGKMA